MFLNSLSKRSERPHDSEENLGESESPEWLTELSKLILPC